MSGTRVVWVTTGFPRGKGEQFIEAELGTWATRKDVQVVMMPVQSSGPTREMPANFTIDDGLSRAWSSRKVLAATAARALLDRRYHRELADLRRRGALDQATARRALRATAQAMMVERAIAEAAGDGHFDLAYTYWLKPQTAGAIAARRRGLVSRVISRCHNIDLYEEARPSNYLPMARTELVDVDTLFPISEQGCRYVVERYGFDPDRVQLARLGVEICPEDQMAPTGDEGVLELLSISTITPLKRLDVMVRGIALAAQQLPGRTVRWRHFGTGPLQEQVESLAHELLDPLGVAFDFRGQLSHEQLLDVLSSEPTDLVLNTSSSEGVPVSLMETAVRGICALATDVGATVEVVGDDQDALLPADLTPEVLGERIVGKADQCREPERRLAARALVVERFDSSRNFESFVSRALDEGQAG